MFILKKGHQPGVYVPLRALFLVLYLFIPHFLGLPDLFCATTFSLRTSEIQPVLRSTCPNHLILLVRSTTSKSWMPSFVRRESELTSSFALTLQIQRIMAWSLRRRQFSVSAFMAQVFAKTVSMSDKTDIFQKCPPNFVRLPDRMSDGKIMQKITLGIFRTVIEHIPCIFSVKIRDKSSPNSL